MWLSEQLLSWNHIHPALVHFTIALFPVSLVTDLTGRFTDRYSLTSAAWWMLLYGAIAAPFTAVAGWMWASDLGPVTGSALGSSLSVHRWLGVGLAVAIPLLAVWRGRAFSRSVRPGVLYLIFAALVCVFLGYQGFIGGKMTIG